MTLKCLGKFWDQMKNKNPKDIMVCQKRQENTLKHVFSKFNNTLADRFIKIIAPTEPIGFQMPQFSFKTTETNMLKVVYNDISKFNLDLTSHQSDKDIYHSMNCSTPVKATLLEDFAKRLQTPSKAVLNTSRLINKEILTPTKAVTFTEPPAPESDKIESNDKPDEVVDQDEVFETDNDQGGTVETDEGQDLSLIHI